MQTWSPTSWLNYAYQQAASYPDSEHLSRVVAQLHQCPPLITRGDVLQLKHAIARAARGEAFILQGGDCAESFADCRSDVITNKLNILLQMSLVLFHGMGKPVIRVGRIAGQYTKPRSSDIETVDGITLPSYRGDLVNSPEFTAEARIPDPNLLLKGYDCAATTLNYIRQNSRIDEGNFFTSHEALHLHYEQALTREVSEGQWFNLSTHLPWIGIRTATLDSAHLELLRGVQNPIGVKIGPDATAEWLTAVLQMLNPNKEEGKILLISRMGAEQIEPLLPALIDAAKTSGVPVTWSCDPMHGNTEFTSDGIKTRRFDTILLELQRAVNIHRDMGSHLGGVHFELTGDNVTECIGGACGLSERDLKHAYHSLVDPRLNYDQSMEMAIQLSRQFIK